MSGTVATGLDTAVTEGTEPTTTGTQPRTLTARTARISTPTQPTDPFAPGEPGEPWTDDPYAHALRAGRGTLFLRRLSPPDHPDGLREEVLPLDVERWCAPPTPPTPAC